MRFEALVSAENVGLVSAGQPVQASVPAKSSMASSDSKKQTD
jgi:hypothetical protein